MIGSCLKACLFVIGRGKQSSLPPPLSESRRLTHTHIFPLHPRSSPLWRCKQDGIKQRCRVLLHLDETLFDTAASMTRGSQLRSLIMPPTSQPRWENGDRSGDLLVRLSSGYFPPSHISFCLGFLGLHELLERCVVSEVDLCVFFFWVLTNHHPPTCVRQSGKQRRNGLRLCSEHVWMPHCDKYYQQYAWECYSVMTFIELPSQAEAENMYGPFGADCPHFGETSPRRQSGSTSQPLVRL